MSQNSTDTAFLPRSIEAIRAWEECKDSDDAPLNNAVGEELQGMEELARVLLSMVV